MEKKQVVIVGAGVSGLAAASALSTNGNFDVTLLEAESRIGGRIHTIYLNGEKIELGAKWIHGKEGNAVYEVLSKHLDSSAFKLIDERYETSHNCYIMFTSGNKLTPKALECFHNSRNLLYSIECDIKDRLQSQQVSENELKDISVKEYATQIWDKEYRCEHTLGKSQSNAIWTNIMAMMGVVDGANPDTSSCLLYNYYKEIDGDIELCGSFSVLLDFLKKGIPNGSIKLNSKVTSIYWNEDSEKFPLHHPSPILKGNNASSAEYSDCHELSSTNVSNTIRNVMHNGVEICTFTQNSESSNNIAESALNGQPNLNESQNMKVATCEVTQPSDQNELNYASSHTNENDTTKCQVAQSCDQNVSNVVESFMEEMSATKCSDMSQQNGINFATKCQGTQSSDQLIIEKSGREATSTTKPECRDMSQQNGTLIESKNQDKVQISYVDESGCTRFIDADHVIVTVSLGVLKKYHKELFKPNLPIQKQECIEKMGFGVVGKLCIQFPKRIWDDSDFALYLLCDSNYDDTDPRSWCKELDLVEIFHGHTLIAWLNKHALKKIKDITKDEIWQHLYDIIKQHFDKTIPTPDDIFVTQWGQNENFLGSYSYTALGETSETRKIACEPLHVNGIPRITFAGEAFHESRFGTVDGAYLTGLREAKRIIKCYEQTK